MADTQADRVKAGREILAKLNFLDPKNPARLSSGLMETTVEHLFGTIWSRPAIPIEQRSLLTLTCLVALNREAELYIHFRGARNLGITKETLEEMILHVAHYAGWPCAVSANRVLEDVWTKMDEEGAGNA